MHKISLLVVCVMTMLIGQHCGQQGPIHLVTDSIMVRKNLPSSPVLTAAESIKKMHIENGFEVKLVAAEPLVTAPVALNFDQKDRIWVVEMQGYMNDTIGSTENIPDGKIVILSDSNHDGQMDSRKIFLDSLVLPRAICLIEDGILVAEPPNLWYYEIKNDKPRHKILIDSVYAEGGNVEHQPNGLLRAMDNWIYSAKSDKRYRKKGNKWLIEKTHFRGQWGITQDDAGRLLNNNNSENLLGDYFSPGLGAANDHQHSVAGYNEKIVADNSVFPVRPTPGVNRGYQKGVLDDSLRLVNFTAACGPVFYNDNLLGAEYYGNVFVAEPSANLIKRNIISEKGYVIEGKQAYHGKEFLASEDERFRPVSLYNSPGGALYIIDMYRGIIQHKTYLTPYLKNEIKERNLTQPLSCGRIYKLLPSGKNEANNLINTNTDALIKSLSSSNGWIRNNAQQQLVDKKDLRAITALRANLKDTSQPLTLIHSLWTLEGMNALTKEDLLPLITNSDQHIRAQAMSALPSIVNNENSSEFLKQLNELANLDDTLSAPYIAYLMHYFQRFDPAEADKILMTLAIKYPNNIYVADAIISSLKNKEDKFYKNFTSTNGDTTLIINRQLKKLISAIAEAKNNSGTDPAKKFPKGAALFQSVCQVCHGSDGNGVTGLAPPLNNSNWVQGNPDKLISIVLYGLNGPVNVAGKIYRAPEINGEMPGIGSNKEISDEEIAQVLSFIRNSWHNKASTISNENILAIRNKYKDRSKPFTAEELNK